MSGRADATDADVRRAVRDLERTGPTLPPELNMLDDEGDGRATVWNADISRSDPDRVLEWVTLDRDWLVNLEGWSNPARGPGDARGRGPSGPAGRPRPRTYRFPGSTLRYSRRTTVA